MFAPVLRDSKLAGPTAYRNEIERPLRMLRGCRMGVSDPEVRKKLSEPRWLQYKHESEKQSWPWWKRLIHRFQRCPICKPEEV